jgi:large subunit ribosomal protein L28
VAAVCEICGKGPGFGMNLSHSHRRTKRRWNPNIQRVRALVNGTPTHLYVCTSCIRAGKVQKPPVRVRPEAAPGGASAEVAARRP